MKIGLQKTGKTKFETLDSTIITDDQNGKQEHTGLRIEEANSEMATAMGVSKAILNNVIFCHQEDSCWPLDEGKKLKEKFDAIFGTTEYNKAIDKIIKFRKEYQSQLGKCVIEKRHLQEIKSDADRKLLDFDLLKQKQDKMSKKVDGCDELLKPIKEQIRVVLEKEKDFGQLHAKKGSFQAT